MRFRLVIEIEMPDESSPDDAIMWAESLVAIAKGQFRDGSDRPFHPYRPRVVSATPLSERKL